MLDRTLRYETRNKRDLYKLEARLDELQDRRRQNEKTSLEGTVRLKSPQIEVNPVLSFPERQKRARPKAIVDGKVASRQTAVKAIQSCGAGQREDTPYGAVSVILRLILLHATSKRVQG